MTGLARDEALALEAAGCALRLVPGTALTGLGGRAFACLTTSAGTGVPWGSAAAVAVRLKAPIKLRTVEPWPEV